MANTALIHWKGCNRSHDSQSRHDPLSLTILFQHDATLVLTPIVNSLMAIHSDKSQFVYWADISTSPSPSTLFKFIGY